MLKRVLFNVTMTLGIVLGYPLLMANNLPTPPLPLLYAPPNPLNTVIVPHDLFIIHSIPKCGTHLIQRIVKFMTNQVVVQGHIGIKNLQKAYADNVIMRTFEAYFPQKLQIANQAGYKVIALVRDPRDALISHVFYMRSYADKPDNKTVRDFFVVGPGFDLLSIEEQITSLITGSIHTPSYLNFYKERMGWACHPSNLMVKYEDLVGPRGGGRLDVQKYSLLKMAQYIHLKLTPQHLQYVLDNLYLDFGQEEEAGKVFKHSSIGNWKTFFTEKHKQLFKQIMGKELIQLGYENDLNW